MRLWGSNDLNSHMESNIIINACNALQNGKIDAAKIIIENEYPHRPLMPTSRNYTKYQSTIIFFRDGFIDRYSGSRLIFSPVLQLLSKLMPETFPFHKNWKISECHMAYWQLFPTIDHLVPVARGGKDEVGNRVTTSMLRNSAKSNWLVEELGWTLYPPGRLKEWDGLINWFLEYSEHHPEVLIPSYINLWHKTAKRAIETFHLQKP